MRIAFVGDSLTEGIPGSSFYAVLRKRLTGHTLVNLGKGNDTVISLYRRLTRSRFGDPFDIAFVWIGVNDIAGGSPLSFQIVNALVRKPHATSRDEFRAYCQATLDLLCRHARRVIAVSPLLKGEDIHNPWNRELEVLARVIEELTSHYERAEYVDLRRVFVQRLAGRRITSYLPRSVIRVALDALTLRSDEQIDRQSAGRGLHLTLDGIHLNSVGAGLVTEMFLGAITH
jgi:lysophospholipase L1-like esterase